MSESEIVIPIRYDGLDAEKHEIELFALGESIQGIARILAVAGHFAATGQYGKQMQALDVRVLVTEPKANCFTMQAAMEFVHKYELFSGLAAAIVTPLLAYIFARAANNRAEMKAIKDSLDKVLAQGAANNAEMVQRMMGTIDRLADALRPSVKSAVAPVGRTCTQMRIGSAPVIDEAAADAIRSQEADELTAEQAWVVTISEMDRETGSAKVRFVDEAEEDSTRFRARIIDPGFSTPGNPYLTAFATGKPLRVTGKASLRDGEVQTLYITDAKQPEAH